MPFCETKGEISCMCDTEVDACKRCCRPSHNATCKPTEPMEILRDGTPCIHGYCEKGRCEKTVQDIVERFWDIIEDIDINTVLKFLNDNIVGTVIVVSIIVWVPGSCLISYVDHKRRAEYEKSKKICRKRDSLQPFRLPSDASVKVVRISGRRTSQSAPPQDPLVGPSLRMPARAQGHSADYWSSPAATAYTDRNMHTGPRLEGRLYNRMGGAAESYGRHDDYYQHHPAHPQTYCRPGSRSRQHMENYTAL